MKSSESFKAVIQEHLKKMGDEDPEFNFCLGNPKKNIDDCITYILNTVKSSGCNGFTDDEIFGMAAHYYDEESIDVGKAISGQVVINRHVELTEEEKAEAKKKALEQAIAEAKNKMIKKPTAKMTVVPQKVEQGSLF